MYEPSTVPPLGLAVAVPLLNPLQVILVCDVVAVNGNGSVIVTEGVVKVHPLSSVTSQ